MASEATEAVDIPRRTVHPHVSRKYAREWYWNHHDYEEYECPDCGRGKDRVYQFEVHHIDGDPTNNHLDNLVGVCRRCHSWRHHTGPTITGLDTEEWKENFLALGGET